MDDSPSTIADHVRFFVTVAFVLAFIGWILGLGIEMVTGWTELRSVQSSIAAATKYALGGGAVGIVIAFLGEILFWLDKIDVEVDDTDTTAPHRYRPRD